MSIFETDKHERFTELGMAIDRLMIPACETAIAFELGAGATRRVALARVSRNNPFTVENIRHITPDITRITPDTVITQDELDCVWLLCAVDVCLSAIL